MGDRPRRRRLRLPLAGLMTLVAAIAVGLAIERASRPLHEAEAIARARAEVQARYPEQWSDDLAASFFRLPGRPDTYVAFHRPTVVQGAAWDAGTLVIFHDDCPSRIEVQPAVLLGPSWPLRRAAGPGRLPSPLLPPSAP